MRLFLISLFSLCVAQCISAAHPDHENIKSTLREVGKGTLLLDDALEIIVGTELKTKIIKDTYQKDFHDFFFDVRHLYIFTQPGETRFVIFFCNLLSDSNKKNLPLDAQTYIDRHSYILSKIETKYPNLYKEVMEPLEDCKSILNEYKPTFMCVAKNTTFLANGTDTTIIYDTQKKNSTIFKARISEAPISWLAPIKNRATIKVNTPDVFCCQKYHYFVDNTHTEFQVIPLFWNRKISSPSLSCITTTDDPSLLCGIEENKNELLLIRFKEEDMSMHPISVSTQTVRLEETIGLGTLGCRMIVRLSDQKFAMITPYSGQEYEKINYCDFSCAQAAMLYRVIQDKKNKTTIASAEEHTIVQKLIPDAYKKTLKKE